jgi:hypothetical protein
MYTCWGQSARPTPSRRRRARPRVRHARGTAYHRSVRPSARARPAITRPRASPPPRLARVCAYDLRVRLWLGHSQQTYLTQLAPTAQRAVCAPAVNAPVRRDRASHVRDVRLTSSCARAHRACVVCPVNQFSAAPGSGACTSCPGNSVSAAGSTNCTCSADYFSADSFATSSACSSM